jgi:adenosylhomocysteine nucleosidase
MRKQKINILVAHLLEAKPLIKEFGLLKVFSKGESPISGLEQTYMNEDGVILLVTGMGKSAMTQGVQALYRWQLEYLGLEPGLAAIWLNIGIAGHRTAELGSGYLAHKIVDQETGECCYPGMLIEGFETSEVCTVDEPETVYLRLAVYDMEAAAFYRAASEYSSSEFIQCFKIISDNLATPINQFKRESVFALIASHGKSLAKLLKQLLKLADEFDKAYALPNEYKELQKNYSLSVSHQQQILRLCQRYYALSKKYELTSVCSQKFANARELVIGLDAGLRSSRD